MNTPSAPNQQHFTPGNAFGSGQVPHPTPAVPVPDKKSKTPGWLKVVGGVVVTLITAQLVSVLGIGHNMQITLDGPRTVYMKPAPNGGLYQTQFTLTGTIDSDYAEAHWTDTNGTKVDFGGDQLFYCPRPGQYTIWLTATNAHGDATQASHDIDCIARA